MNSNAENLSFSLEGQPKEQQQPAMADSAAELEAHPQQAGGALQTAKDLFSGAAGGVAQVLLGKMLLCP